MKATKVVYSAGPNEVVCTMSRPEAQSLKGEMEDLAQAWPSPTLLQGDSPFARIYQELTRALT